MIFTHPLVFLSGWTWSYLILHWIRSITKSGWPSNEQIYGGREAGTPGQEKLSLTHSVCLYWPLALHIAVWFFCTTPKLQNWSVCAATDFKGSQVNTVLRCQLSFKSRTVAVSIRSVKFFRPSRSLHCVGQLMQWHTLNTPSKIS